MASRSNARWALGGWVALAALIGYLDYVTGPFVSLTLFYLAPVVGAAWFAGRGAGLIVAVGAGLGSLLSDLLLATGNTGTILYWNTASRTLVLAIAAVVIDRIREDRRALEASDAQRSRSLQLLDRGLTGPAKEALELLKHWDGSVDQLRAMLRPRLETMAFLARDFTEMIRLQRGQVPVNRTKLDLLAVVEELRTEQMRERPVALVAPTERLMVIADRSRLRQSIAAMLALAGHGDELSLSLTRRDKEAELRISSQGGSAWPDEAAVSQDEVSLSVELARLLLVAQGGTLDVSRNPMTRSLRAVARLPLA
ncbi:MAG: hypothetical protein M3R21_05315 [Candidatus Dormibacteraeota bacterium]|nr:hypothetical protein [Candidatus Dormibacteraeota bacterium]